MKKFLIFIFTVFILLAATFLFRSHSDIGSKPHYVGKESCAECHALQYEGHNATLHPLIFRPVTSPDDIVGDFDRSDPLVTFKKEEITHVVGNKWEQVYMHIIDGEYYPFTAKWMISTQKWVPYKVHDWLQTPASTKCNGCHTTGFDPKTYRFSEYGVNCESCHGPASLHVSHRRMTSKASCLPCHKTDHNNMHDDIIVSQKTSVCGQCHSRGKTTAISVDGQTTLFNFPLEYLPGQEINASFRPSTLANDPKNKNWWGNGVAKNRHQEFADFSASKHSKALENLRSKKNPHGGEKSDACLQCHSQDYRSAPEGEKPTLQTATLGLTCVSCHDPHGIDRKMSTSVPLKDKCGECHMGTFAKNEAPLDKAHFPCPSDKVSCADCHMPYIVKTGGTYTIRSHAFKIIPPEASLKYDMPNSCQNGSCHADKSVEWALNAYNDFYKRPTPQTLADTLKKP